MNKSESYASVWGAIEDTPGQAANTCGHGLN
jgi:hypothetical protein